RWHPLALAPAAAALVGLSQLAARLSVYPFVTENAIVNWAAYFVLFLVSLEAFAEPDTRRRFLRVTLYAGFAIATLSTAQYFTSNGAIYWMFPTRSGRAF